MNSSLVFNPHNNTDELRITANSVSELRVLEKIKDLIKDEKRCAFTGLDLDTLIIRVK